MASEESVMVDSRKPGNPCPVDSIEKHGKRLGPDASIQMGQYGGATTAAARAHDQRGTRAAPARTCAPATPAPKLLACRGRDILPRSLRHCTIRGAASGGRHTGVTSPSSSPGVSGGAPSMEAFSLKMLRRAALAALLAASLAARAYAQHVDGIAAVVNEEAILESDVEEQLYMLLARAQQQPDSSMVDTLRRQVLEQLIDDKLIVAEAQHQGMTVSDNEVSRAVDQQINQKIQELGGAPPVP